MIVLLGLGLGAAAGVGWPRLTLLAGSVYLPVPALMIVAALAVMSRRSSDTRPALFCEGVAAELRAGSSLRQAIASAASAADVSGLDTHLNAELVASQLRSEFPEVGEELALTFQGALRAGNDPAALFEEIAAFALARAEIDSEVRVATTPGIATAAVLVGAPVVFVLFQIDSGAIGQLLSSSGQRFAGLLGLALFVLGAATASLVLWRSRT